MIVRALALKPRMSDWFARTESTGMGFRTVAASVLADAI